MIRSVLFDLDGVLVETRDLHFRALNHALVAHNYLPITADEHDKELNGLSTRQKLEILCNRGRVPQTDVASVAALKQKETRRLLESEVKFDPGVFSLLWSLRKNGYLVGVVTNAIRDTAELVLSKLIDSTPVDPRPFHVIVTNEDGAPKPSPELYFCACRRMGYHPDECLAVEDGHYGIEAATAAGCKVLAVTGPADVTPQRIWENLC